jgi:hypothetical protein
MLVIFTSNISVGCILKTPKKQAMHDYLPVLIQLDKNIRDFRFSQLWEFRLWSSRLWHHAVL